MPENKALIAICTGHAHVERAIAELQRLDFEMTHLSAFGKAYLNDEEVVGCYTAGGRLRTHGWSFAFWERLWNLLGEGGFLFVPGIGPIVFAGPFVRTFAATIENNVTVGGLSPLGAAIYSLGIHKDSILRYEIEIRANECALLATGLAKALAKARIALEKVGATEIITSDECRLKRTDEVLQMAR
ncbi:MAG: hypothetical protein ABSG53_25600 [Thermoguttaceae bacterium]|jgi:hypothetical protein